MQNDIERKLKQAGQKSAQEDFGFKSHDEKDRLFPVFDAFANAFVEQGQKGSIGKVPSAFQTLVRKQKDIDKIKDKILDTQAYDACRQFYSFLSKEGYIQKN